MSYAKTPESGGLALVAFMCEVLGGLSPLLQVMQIAEYRLRGHNSCFGDTDLASAGVKVLSA